MSAARGGEAAIPALPTLEKELAKESPEVLAKEAREKGEAARGAILFYQKRLTCMKCHEFGKETEPLGPDLTKPEKEPTDVFLVESILQPSKEIRKGYEPIVVITDAGKAITGLLVKEDDKELVLRDPAQDGKEVTIAKDEIDEQEQSKQSVMPAELINQLGNRQQFLDLLRYVMEVSKGGLPRARQLEPEPSLYAPPPLPEYEKHIDHAGMIGELNQESYKRGEAIYSRLCVNCHGTKDEPGSLPTSLRFASGKFRNGSDLHGMYKTLTHGFGLMIPQTWMVPQQKYDAAYYIREAYLKEHNQSQYTLADETYLAGLPKGDTKGPAPSKFEPWVAMDYGPNLTASYEIGTNASNFAYKGMAVRLDPGGGGISRGRYWVIYDEDTLRVAAGWSGEHFIDYNAIMLNGRHAIHPRVVGDVHFENKTGPGWGNPETGSFEDPRFIGRNNRLYGPLPRDWAHYKGLYHQGNRVIVSYIVGETNVLEMPAVDASSDTAIFTRTMNLGPRSRDMILQVAERAGTKSTLLPTAGSDPATGRIALFGKESAEPADGVMVAGISQPIESAQWLASDEGHLRLKIPAGNEPLKFTLSVARVEKADQVAAVVERLAANESAMDLAPLTKGGPPRWPGTIATEAVVGEDKGPFAVDVLTHPTTNPWFCRVRLTGFDFLPDGNRAAVCSWDGNVWMVTGIARPEEGLTWQRIASGMFQPLGVKYLNDKIYVTCRDQISVLHDLNGDGETDFYESFNNDHQVTEHFHEFAMGLQADAEGNFYYAKACRHALPALVPHHGTLLKVSKDGSRTEILAKGFRVANGVCINPDGSFFVTDQEGHWTPKNRINWVPGKGGYYGNMYGYHDVTDTSDEAMLQPVCWITNSFDRSPAELLWVTSDQWGPLKGSLLNTSYGYGMVYIVPHEEVNGQLQGGMCRLPIPMFPTGVMRPRFHGDNGQLYLAGMFAWAGSRNQPGGFYRLRYTGRPVHLPVGLHATKQGMTITFSGELDREAAEKAENYSVKIWGLKRTANYGSPHVNERPLEVTGAKLSEDGKTVSLAIPKIETTWCMEIRYRIKGLDGEPVDNMIHNSIFNLGD